MALSPWPEAAAKMGLMLLEVTNVSERGIETIPSMGSYHLQPPSNETANMPHPFTSFRHKRWSGKNVMAWRCRGRGHSLGQRHVHPTTSSMGLDQVKWLWNGGLQKRLVDFMENPVYKWMMTGGTPMTWETTIYVHRNYRKTMGIADRDPGHPTAVQRSPPPARTIGIWWSVDKTLKATAESRLTFDQSRARPRSIPLVGKDPVAQVHMKHVQVCIYIYI